MNKIPRIINKKWKRYNKIEKIFLFFLAILLISEFFLPFIKIDGNSYSFINSKFLLTSIILLFTLLFIVIWNISYTFKGFIKSIFGFEQNDAILNFGIFFVHATILIYTKDILGLLSVSKSAKYYTLDYGFYIIGFFIVIGLIWNLFLAINLSMMISNKQKSNYSKIVGANILEKDEKKDIKTLF